MPYCDGVSPDTQVQHLGLGVSVGRDDASKQHQVAPARLGTATGTLWIAPTETCHKNGRLSLGALPPPYPRNEKAPMLEAFPALYAYWVTNVAYPDRIQNQRRRGPRAICELWAAAHFPGRSTLALAKAACLLGPRRPQPLPYEIPVYPVYQPCRNAPSCVVVSAGFSCR